MIIPEKNLSSSEHAVNAVQLSHKGGSCILTLQSASKYLPPYQSPHVIVNVRNVPASRRSKTSLRSTGLALRHIHYSMELVYDEIIRRFARLRPRRLDRKGSAGHQPTADRGASGLWARGLLPMWFEHRTLTQMLQNK